MRTMQEIGNKFSFTDDNGKVDYEVEIPQGDYLLVSAGVDYTTAATNFDSYRILQKKKKCSFL